MSHEPDEAYAVYNERFPRARKSHICDACKETIRTGDRYAHVGIVFEGEGETIRRCLRCQRMHEELRQMDPGRLWPDERLDCGQKYEEEWGEPPPSDVASLAFLTPDEAQAALQPGEED